MTRSFLTCVHLLLAFSSCLGEGRRPPHMADDGAPLPDAGREQSPRGVLLEAVKTGILSSLGMDREPTRPAENKASDPELKRMFWLYREKLRELRGNSTQSMTEHQYSPPPPRRMSTVLYPATVHPVKDHGSTLGEHTESPQHIQWYRAVFQKNPNIQTELTLVRAELKVYRQILDESVPDDQAETLRQKIQVRISGVKPLKSPLFFHANVSTAEALTVDVKSEMETWRWSDDVQSLVVDVGLTVGDQRDSSKEKENPRLYLELDLSEPRPAAASRRRRRRRQPRSSKEDCDEQGRCCRKTVTVSFREIGWSDWVVAPATYTMHFCDGSCPHNYKPASMHTQVKSRLHQLTSTEIHQPCCVPAAYEPMVLMHYDSRGRLKLTPYADLIVSKCHCA